MSASSTRTMLRDVEEVFATQLGEEVTHQEDTEHVPSCPQTLHHRVVLEDYALQQGMDRRVIVANMYMGLDLYVVRAPKLHDHG